MAGPVVDTDGLSIPVAAADIPLGFEPLDRYATLGTSVIDIVRIIRGDINQWQRVIIDDEPHEQLTGIEVAACHGRFI